MASDIVAKGHTGGLTASDMIVDPETGYLYHPTRPDGLSPDKKKAVVMLLSEGSTVEGALEQVGVSVGQWYKHVAIDKRLRGDCEAWKKAWAYRIEGKLAQYALDPNRFMDRAMYLRAYLPEKYAPETKQNAGTTIHIDGNVLIQAQQERKRIESVIDAEVLTNETNTNSSNEKINSPSENE